MNTVARMKNSAPSLPKYATDKVDYSDNIDARSHFGDFCPILYTPSGQETGRSIEDGLYAGSNSAVTATNRT